ncbi:hypothetical protein V6N13_023314 [Hibiscus sabdariffa]
MKAEKLDAALRSRPATIVKMGMNNPPPPMPPALDTMAAVKQHTAARTVGVDSFSWFPWDFISWDLQWRVLLRKLFGDGDAVFSMEK